MRVTALTEADLTDLARLYRQFRGEESSLEEMKVAFRRLENDPDYTLLGVREDGRLIGSVTDADRTGALGFYENLGYHPDKFRACKKYLDPLER